MADSIPIEGFSRRIAGWGNPMRQRCKCCGMPDKFNFHVPDKVWAAVVPPKLQTLVVCLSCFDDLALSAGVDYRPHLSEIWFAGDQVTISFEPVR